MQVQPRPTPFLDELNHAIKHFGGIRVNDLEERYVKWPTEEQSKLGKGSYGEAFRVRAVDADRTREPERVAKFIMKSRIATIKLQVQHLCVELATSGFIQHHNLNRRVGLFHNDTHIFVILELCGGPRPNLTCRLAHLFAYRRSSRFPEIDSILAEWSRLAERNGVNPHDQKALSDFVDNQGLMKSLAAECGVNLTRDNPELPVGNDLFNFIVAYRRLSDPLAQVITRQILQGVEFLHANQIVHRDLKTQNVVVGIIRKAVLKRDENGRCVGATFFEKVDCKIIDFGLAKYMNIAATTVSPGAFIHETEASAKKSKNDGDDDDNDEEKEKKDEKDTAMQQEWGHSAQTHSVPIQLPPAAGSAGALDGIGVTPCGTNVYLSLEAIRGVITTLGDPAAKWSSTKHDLPKMDVFGIGCILYCMSNGTQPFHELPNFRRLPNKMRMDFIQSQIAVGPIFTRFASEPSRAMTVRLMDNAITKRYTCDQALLDAFVKHNSDTVVTDADFINGITEIRLGVANEFANVVAAQNGLHQTGAVVAPAENNNTNIREETSDILRNVVTEEGGKDDDEENVADMDDVMEALRLREDGDDKQTEKGKNNDDDQ